MKLRTIIVGPHANGNEVCGISHRVQAREVVSKLKVISVLRQTLLQVRKQPINGNLLSLIPDKHRTRINASEKKSSRRTQQQSPPHNDRHVTRTVPRVNDLHAFQDRVCKKRECSNQNAVFVRCPSASTSKMGRRVPFTELNLRAKYQP